MKSARFNRLCFIVAAFACAINSYASLGGNVDSVQADAIKVKASVSIQPARNAEYSVHELTLPSKTVLRQYVSANGLVFGVAWSGPYMPNLRQLLGPSFDTLVAQESKAGFNGHSLIQINEPNLVILAHGHVGHFAGRAFLPQNLPANVKTDDIQ